MRKHIITALRYLHGAFLVAAILPMISAILSLFGGGEMRVFLTSLIVLLPYVVVSIAGARCKTIYTFLLFSAASIVVTIVVAPTIPEKIIYPFLGTLILIIRTAGRLNEKDDILNTPHPAAALLFALLYLISFGIENELLRTVNYYLAFAYVILVLIYMNLSSLDSYLEVNREIANIPHRQISRTNSAILSIFVGLTAIVMIFLPRTGLDQVIMAIIRGFREVIRLLLRLLQREGPPPEETTAPVEETLPPEGGGMPPAGETPAWLQVFYQVLTYIIVIAVGIMLLYLLVRGIINVIKRFYRPIKENDDVQEFLDPNKESRSYAAAMVSDRPGFFDFSQEATVRKQYKRLIEQRGKDHLDFAYTPDELEDAAKLPEGSSRSRLHELYEKARYSKEGSDPGDAREVRRLRF